MEKQGGPLRRGPEDTPGPAGLRCGQARLSDLERKENGFWGKLRLGASQAAPAETSLVTAPRGQRGAESRPETVPWCGSGAGSPRDHGSSWSPRFPLSRTGSRGLPESRLGVSGGRWRPGHTGSLWPHLSVVRCCQVSQELGRSLQDWHQNRGASSSPDTGRGAGPLGGPAWGGTGPRGLKRPSQELPHIAARQGTRAPPADSRPAWRSPPAVG